MAKKIIFHNEEEVQELVQAVQNLSSKLNSLKQELHQTIKGFLERRR